MHRPKDYFQDIFTSATFCLLCFGHSTPDRQTCQIPIGLLLTSTGSAKILILIVRYSNPVYLDMLVTALNFILIWADHVLAVLWGVSGNSL